MKKCNLCGESEEEKFYKYSNTRCKRCICDAQLERNRKNPDYLKAKNQRRRAKKMALPNTLTTKQWTDIQKRFGGKCAISDSTDIVLEHVIPLDWLHGGTILGNVIPMDKTLNLSKRDKNFIDWIFQPEIEEQIDEDKLNDLLEYLAEVNELTVQQFLDFVYWCEENKRTPEEAAHETRSSVKLFRKSLLSI